MTPDKSFHPETEPLMIRFIGCNSVVQDSFYKDLNHCSFHICSHQIHYQDLSVTL